VPKIWCFPLTLIVALVTALRTTVLDCDTKDNVCAVVIMTYSYYKGYYIYCECSHGALENWASWRV